MKRVAEVIYVVDSEREAFLKGALNLTEEEKKVLWMCGVRKQQYFAVNDMFFMTFEYKGNNFKEDMNKMASYLDSKGLLIKTRRKEVPIEDRRKVSWWAPVKKLGSLLESNPFENETELDVECMEMLNATATAGGGSYDTSFDEDDWTDSIHF